MCPWLKPNASIRHLAVFLLGFAFSCQTRPTGLDPARLRPRKKNVYVNSSCKLMTILIP
jgi:hypothetical protein